MSTPTNGSPHDPRHDGGYSGSQHSAPDFGGGRQQDRGQGGQSSHEVPSYGSPSSGQGSSGAPQYRPANGTPQYSPSGGQFSGNQYSGGQYGGGQYGGPQQGGRTGKGKPPLWVGLTSLGLGILLGVIAVIVLIVGIAGAVNQVADTPAGMDQTLEDDTQYFVFSTEATSVDECTVYDPEYTTVAFETADSEQTASDGSATFTLLGTFTTDDAGVYDVNCSPYVADDALYVSDAGVGGAVGGVVGGIVLGLIGGLLFLLGIILIIVNRVSAAKNRG